MVAARASRHAVPTTNQSIRDLHHLLPAQRAIATTRGNRSATRSTGFTVRTCERTETENDLHDHHDDRVEHQQAHVSHRASSGSTRARGAGDARPRKRPSSERVQIGRSRQQARVRFALEAYNPENVGDSTRQSTGIDEQSVSSPRLGSKESMPLADKCSTWPCI
jgi:hypothetical protein